MSPITAIEEAIVALFLEEITEDEAVARLRSAVNVTDQGARDLLQDRRSPRSRYEAIGRD